MRIFFYAPANDRTYKSKVNVKDDNGILLFTDFVDLRTSAVRKSLAKKLAKRFGKDQEDLLRQVEEKWNQSEGDLEKLQTEQRAVAAKPTAPDEAVIMDAFPDVIRRPLSLIGRHSYAATWVTVQVTVHAGVGQDGQPIVYDPPQLRAETRLLIVRNDGEKFTATPTNGFHSLAELGVAVELPTMPPVNRLWTGAGVKRFLSGERPNPAEVFQRVASVVDKCMDFSRSLSSQEAMCEMTACYVLSTYLLDAFNVIGYLWPNGNKGTGKTNLLHVVCEMGYLGLVILAGGTYPSIRDLADYGATLGFDDAEGIMDLKRADPDKRALLLAGNRRGATVTFKEKESVGGKYTIRYVNAFCPRLFSAIKLPDDVLGSRTIIVPLIRTGDGAKVNPVDHEKWPCDRSQLLDDLWAVGLTGLPKMKAFDTAAAENVPLVGRNLEPWRAILAVALWLEEEHGVNGLFGRMKNLSDEYQGERGNLEERDPIRVLIKALWRMLNGHDDSPKVFTPKELASHMNQIAEEEGLVDDEEDEQGKKKETFTNPKKVGWLLRKERFTRDNRNPKAKVWKTDLVHAKGLTRTYGMIWPSEDTSEVGTAEPPSGGGQG